MAQAARTVDGKVGASVLVVETGERAGVRAADRFPMQSVYKFPIAMAVLHLVDAGKLKLDDPVTVARAELVPAALHSPIRDAHPQGDFPMPLRDILRYAVAESDGTASDVLVRLAGGCGSVAAYLRDLGIANVTIATTELEMSSGDMVQYRNWATPDGMTGLLAAFQKGAGLSAESRALLLQWMTESTPGPKRLKGLLPAGTVVAHKTGTSGTQDGLTRATNDVGLITMPDGRHLAVTVFVADSRAPLEAREGVIARVARMAWDQWSRK
ncbi:MAG: serine hydrolase [Proteobacteria bacterium]|nr:MAG: serine hydrolase [Pseudomonadota bacterium]